jgi:hypothetical protein
VSQEVVSDEKPSSTVRVRLLNSVSLVPYRNPYHQCNQILAPPAAETCAGRLVMRANLIGDTDFDTELVIRN